MTALSKLNDLARAELEDLEDAGIHPTPEEVVQVNHLASLVETPTARRELSRGRPVVLNGGAVLWPRTLVGIDWFNDVDGHAWSSELKLYALAYAMAHGRNSDAFNGLYGDDTAAECAVRAWVNSLPVTDAELLSAVTELIMQEDDGTTLPPSDSDDGKTATLGDLSMILTASVGGPPELWERQVSISYVRDMLSTIVAQNRVDDRPHDTDPKIRAEKALGYAIMKVRERHAQEQESNG